MEVNMKDLEQTILANWGRVLKQKHDAESPQIYRHSILIVCDDLQKIENLSRRLFNDKGEFDFQCVKPLPDGVTLPDDLTFERLVAGTLDCYLDLKSHADLTHDELIKRLNEIARKEGFTTILHWMKHEWDLVGDWHIKNTIKHTPVNSHHLSFEFESDCPTCFFHYLINDKTIGLTHTVVDQKSISKAVSEINNPYTDLVAISLAYIDCLVEMGYRAKVFYRQSNDERPFIYLENDWENDSPARQNLLAKRPFVEQLFHHLVSLNRVKPQRGALDWYACVKCFERVFAELLFGEDELPIMDTRFKTLPKSVWMQIEKLSFRDRFNGSYDIL